MATSTPTPATPEPPRPIADVARDLGLGEAEWMPYGRYKAKVLLGALEARRARPDGKLVLVSSITPTPAGDGKTTMTIGLGQALCKAGKRAVIALREPSIGPDPRHEGRRHGRRPLAGRAHGRDQPALHRRLPRHHLREQPARRHHRQSPPPRQRARHRPRARCLEARARRERPRAPEERARPRRPPRRRPARGAASSSPPPPRSWLRCASPRAWPTSGRGSGAWWSRSPREGKPVAADALGVTGAMTALLRDAVHPNLVQTMEGTPALVHGGPFANIAHGCNSVVATRMALKLGEICLTEAGFATDLGAEKFFDIKCRFAGLHPDAAMIVATARALKYHGGVRDQGPRGRRTWRRCAAASTIWPPTSSRCGSSACR